MGLIEVAPYPCLTILLFSEVLNVDKDNERFDLYQENAYSSRQLLATRPPSLKVY